MGWLRRRRGNLLGQTAADTLEEQPRDADTFRWLGDVEQDVRYAICIAG